MPPTSELLSQTDKDFPRFAILCELSARIEYLLNSAVARADEAVQACLDDLLGAVYSLFFAVRLEFDSRPGPLKADNIKSVLDRARNMADRNVRTDGKWAAGFYFNNALFRIDAVYHRVLETVTGKSNVGLEKILACACERYRKWREYDWDNEKLGVINNEVIRLKHRESALFAGRKVILDEAVEAIRELLTLLDAFDSSASSSAKT